MLSRILLALALAAPAPLALGQGTISPTPVPDDDIASDSFTLAYVPESTDVAKFYRVGGGGGHKLQIKDATLTVNCAPCVECSPSAECPPGFCCDYTIGPSGGRKLRFGSLEIGCCRAC